MARDLSVIVDPRGWKLLKEEEEEEEEHGME